MDSSSILLSPQELIFFDPSILQTQSKIQKEFIWPQTERPNSLQDLQAPLIDLQGFFSGHHDSTYTAAKLIDTACRSHGFFQVINHGVDLSLSHQALNFLDDFFSLPLSLKLHASRKPGTMWGYSGAHADRFSSKLPWKETLSFPYHNSTISNSNPVVLDYFTSNFGNDFKQFGLVYQKYCEEMEKLALAIMELLAISLGVERMYFRDFFKNSDSIMRCNYYPPCQEPELVLGTGPHCDPTSLTILQQDHVGGLQVFANDQWKAVPPVPDALVINIGDTFMALSNGKYKSCLHRAVVNRHWARKSLAYFLCPQEDKVVRAPSVIVEGPRKYPDFSWAELREFTQKHYRADMNTLQSFSQWLLSSSSSSLEHS
ncbi:Ent-kaurene synthase protein [Dioscorea alata]|uniref:Ent-kaurene synthase protein n=1 Tax=Dioscorea alata TaxID=55571 RepID=A0ACB7WC29_DIOAL|nr:Ent-kaurene synthase protein [Dioscorea alata]